MYYICESVAKSDILRRELYHLVINEHYWSFVEYLTDTVHG